MFWRRDPTENNRLSLNDLNPYQSKSTQHAILCRNLAEEITSNQGKTALSIENNESFSGNLSPDTS